MQNAISLTTLEYDKLALVTHLFKQWRGTAPDKLNRPPETILATRSLLVWMRFPKDLTAEQFTRLHAAMRDEDFPVDFYAYVQARREDKPVPISGQNDLFALLYPYLRR